jgi:hypothetical protein
MVLPAVSSAKRRNFSNQLANNSPKQSGLALFEAAVCMVVGLPLFVMAIGTMILLYDQNAIRVAPVEGLRGVSLSALHYRSGGQEGRLSMDYSVTRQIVSTVAERIFNHAMQEGISLSEVGAKSCAWLYRVDSSTGRALELLQQDCSVQGSSGLAVSFIEELRSATSEPIGLPLRGSQAGYLDRVVLLGAKVEADFNALLFTRRGGFGVVEVPRQEVLL